MSDLSQTIGHETVEAAARESPMRHVFETVACRCCRLKDMARLGVSRGWKRRLTAMAAPAPGQFLVDLAGGTGDAAYLKLGLVIACNDLGTQPQAAAR